MSLTVALLTAALLLPFAPARVAPPRGGDVGAHTAPPVATPGPSHTLFFCMDAPTWTADHGATAGHSETSLGRLYPANVAGFTPGMGQCAWKAVTTPEFDALVGDADHDGVFGEVLGGGLDALGMINPGGAGPITPRLIMSTRLDWGECQPELPEVGNGALDGSLFSIGRDPVSGEPRVRRLLSEALLLKALGQQGQLEADVDIDAFAQDEDGNLYLSFRDDEWVVDVELEDDGVLCVPATRFAVDAQGEIWFIDPACAVVVLDRARVDELVESASVTGPTGTQVHTLGDLQALAIDPAGGRFTPVSPVPGLPDGVPHLLFAGWRPGPTVLSTRDGGRIATIGGWSLGATPAHGGPLGLDPHDSASTAADLQGLLVLPRREPNPLIDTDHLGVDVVYGDEQLAFTLGGFRPNAWAWVLAGAALVPKGDALPSMPSETGVPYPWRLVPQPCIGWPVALDADGRARIVIDVGGKIPKSFVGVLQAYEVGTGRLSAPASLWVY